MRQPDCVRTKGQVMGACVLELIDGTSVASASESLAAEQARLGAGRCSLQVRIDRPCVSVGRTLDPEQEVDVALARERGIEVVRRRSGGGAVYRDEGCIACSMVLPRGLRGEAMDAVARSLQKLGVPVAANERNDLLWGGRKVSGFAWAERGELVLAHCTVLFSTDIALMEQLLAPGKAKYRGTQLERAGKRVANISVLFPQMDSRQFRQELERGLACELDDVLKRSDWREAGTCAARMESIFFESKGGQHGRGMQARMRSDSCC